MTAAFDEANALDSAAEPITRRPVIDRSEQIAARINRSPEHRVAVESHVAAMDDADRAYRMHLATIRQAGRLTQEDIARALGRAQPAIARSEKSSDMLYSSLLAYLEAAGARDVALTATVAGRRIEVVLADAAGTEGPRARLA
jgi:hypothetical protein